MTELALFLEVPGAEDVDALAFALELVAVLNEERERNGGPLGPVAVRHAQWMGAIPDRDEPDRDEPVPSGEGRIHVGAVIPGPGLVVSEELFPPARQRRYCCANGWVFWADPEEDWIEDGFLFLESARVADDDDPAVPPWRALPPWRRTVELPFDPPLSEAPGSVAA